MYRVGKWLKYQKDQNHNLYPWYSKANKIIEYVSIYENKGTQLYQKTGIEEVYRQMISNNSELELACKV